MAASANLAGDASPADRALLQRAIAAIIDGGQAGTRHGIRVDADGLLACGVPGVQLTWMDAKVGGDPVTPRIGKPVEIQALWINALTTAGRTAEADRAGVAFARFRAPPALPAPRHRRRSPSAAPSTPAAAPTRSSPSAASRTRSSRASAPAPSSIPSSASCGPRPACAPSPPAIRATTPTTRGGPAERDRAYHNGTVWPWLAGPFIEAWVRVRGSTPDAKRDARTRFLAPLLARTDLAGLDHLSEICDGDSPHRPAGCPFQAWSLAEALRIDQLLG